MLRGYRIVTVLTVMAALSGFGNPGSAQAGWWHGSGWGAGYAPYSSYYGGPYYGGSYYRGWGYGSMWGAGYGSGYYGGGYPVTSYYGPGLFGGWGGYGYGNSGCSSCSPCGTCSPCSSGCSPCGTGISMYGGDGCSSCSPCGACNGPCSSGNCADGNCPNGNCGANFSSPASNEPTPEPTHANPNPPTPNPPATSAPTYRRDPPVDDFDAVRPRENDTSVPRSTIPPSSIPSTSVPPATRSPGAMPSSTAPVDRTGTGSIPETNYTPVTPRGEESFRLPNTNRGPAPLEPTSREPGIDTVEPVLPLGTEVRPMPAPLNLPSEPSLTVKVERRRIVLEPVAARTRIDNVPPLPQPLPMADIDTGLVLR